MKRLILSIGLFFMCLIVSAQVRTVMGYVTDSDNHPLSEVKVGCESDSIVTFTDIGGIFRISVPQDINILYFSKSGYTPGQAIIGSRTEINVRLEVTRVYDLSFEDLLNTKVSIVSLREQNITDAPGVISVLTHDELSRLGVRTLKEALAMVPGYTLMQNDDEQIFSVRGIFATTNQKILVMRDGHSLNEANLDIPQTEYSLSIQNIEKIEIIRGSGASIYGNSALASVVNVITRKDEKTEVNVGIGNYGQKDVDLYLYDKINEHSNILIWGRYADVKGQPFNVTYQPDKTSHKGTYYAGHYPDNYDIGFKYANRFSSLSVSTRRHDYKTYWTTQGMYTNVDSLLALPGLLMNSIHLNYAYEPKIKENLTLHFIHFADDGKLDNNRLIAPIDPVKYLHGRLQLNEWNASKYGLNYFAQWGYSLKGQMLGGFSVEKRNYYYSWLASNSNDSSRIAFSDKPFYPEGEEVRGAFYIQAQYEFLPWLRLDAGVRYDIAQKFNSSVNPRIAFIVYPQKSLSLKLIYTEAFQAPGYSYRTSNADFSGSIGSLEPEKLSTFQASVRYNIKEVSYFEVVAYHNRLRNLITRTEDNYYANVGRIASYGLELDARYYFSPFSVFCNYSMVSPDKVRIDKNFIAKNINGNEFRHFPQHTANVGIFWDYLKLFDISVYGQYASGFIAMKDFEVEERLVVNTHVRFVVQKDISISLGIYNLFDRYYTMGDPSVIPIEQPGRWWRFMVSYRIK